MIFAFDLDNTLCDPVKSSTDCKSMVHVRPRTNLVTALNFLFQKGHTIIIFTHRSKKCRQHTIQWLKRNNIKFHKLIMDKPKYDLLIDDRSTPPKNYLTGHLLEEYVESIKSFKGRLPNV